MPQRKLWLAICLRAEVFRRRLEQAFVYDPVTGWVFYPFGGSWNVNWMPDGAEVVVILSGARIMA